jgi:hypothetical protein
MRACEGCRRRKIKCDAATTNAWPCAACIRLKLNCVPPTVSYDKDYNNGTQTFELETKPVEYAEPSIHSHHDYQQHSGIPHGLPNQMSPSLPTPVTGTYADGIRMYQTAPYVDQQQAQEHIQYQSMPQPQVVRQNLNYSPHQMYSEAPPPAPPVIMSPPETDGNWRDPTSNLTEALGELKIDYTAIGKIESILRISTKY